MQVQFADKLRGYGAFANQNIACGTFIGLYEGEVLDLEDYYERYQDGMVFSCGLVHVDCNSVCTRKLTIVALTGPMIAV